VRDTKIGIIANYSVGAGIASNSLQFQILPPSDATALASWLGVNLYYRKVVAGTNPAYTQVKLRGMATGAVGSVVTRYFNQLLTYDEVYQFLVVPVTYYSGAETECRNGWFGQGSFHTRQTATDYPTDANWVSRFGWRTDSTSNLLGVIQTGFAPADPVPTVNSWKALNDNVSGGGAVLNNVIPVYYQVVFDVSAITSFNEAYIWRRHNGGLRSGYSTYFGFGRWEKITLTTAFSGYSSGKFTVNLKLPVSFREFNSLISANNSTTLYSTFPVSPVKPFEVPNFGYEEFYIQIKSAGSVSTKAIKLPSVIIPTGTAITDITALKGPPTTVVFADAVKDSQFNSGWNRTLAEARTATNASPLSAPYIYYNGSSGATLDWKAGTI
jgi:hypothetical protein